jgi:Holliday junction resolvase RusA-like endonuclease
MLAEFVITGVPRTAQTKSPKSRTDWRTRINAAARAAWTETQAPLRQEVAVLIIYFYIEETNLDVDGIPKLVLDGMEGIIFEKDSVVSQILCRKTRQDLGLRLVNPSPVLAEAVGSNDHFVYVSLGAAPNHKEIPA